MPPFRLVQGKSPSRKLFWWIFGEIVSVLVGSDIELLQ
jgi:hypothetical protein